MQICEQYLPLPPLRGPAQLASLRISIDHRKILRLRLEFFGSHLSPSKRWRLAFVHYSFFVSLSEMGKKELYVPKQSFHRYAVPLPLHKGGLPLCRTHFLLYHPRGTLVRCKKECWRTDGRLPLVRGAGSPKARLRGLTRVKLLFS